MLVLNRLKLEAQLCRESLFDFLLRFWPVLVEDPIVLNWHIEYLCGELQTCLMRAVKRQPKEYDLVVNVPPASTKSTIFSIMATAWVWTNDPTFRSICGSYAHPLSLHLAGQTSLVLQSEKYRQLFPDVRLVREAQGMLVTSRNGQRIATSTGGSVIGMHGHAIIIDDSINPKEAISDAGIKTANEWQDQTLPSRMVDKRITPMIWVMQRLAQNDPSGHRLDKQGGVPVRHICLPAELTKDVRPRSLRAFYKHGLLDPVRLSQKVLEQAKIDNLEYAYAGQYLQRPVPLGGGMFRTDMIKIHPHKPKLTRFVRYWDKAGTPKGGAFTVGVLMGIDVDLTFWVLDVIRGQWEAASRERMIKQTAYLDTKKTPIAIEQEPGSGGKESAQATVKNLAGFRIKVDRPVGDKETRADPFAMQVNAGNVKLLEGVWNAAYLGELRFFPFSKYKDQVDASSGAFAMLTERRLAVGGLHSLYKT